MRKRNILMTGVLLLGPVWAHAQPAPATPPPPPKQEASAEFAFVGTSGNSSTQSMGLGGEFIDRPHSWVLTTKAAYVRNSSASDLKAESFWLAFQGARTLTPVLSVFGKYGYLHDQFAGIDNRNTVEAGLAYILVNDAPNKLTVDAALGYAREGRVVGDGLSTATWDMGALYTLKLSSTAEISDDGRLIFSLSNGDDWRLGNIVSVSAKLTTLFSLKLSNTIRFVNAPVAGFQKTDTITAIALVAKF